MIERIRLEGVEDTCELKDLRKGDWFRIVDCGGTGFWRIALDNAALRTDKAQTWHISSERCLDVF